MKSEDFKQSKNFNVGENILIEGNKLGGTSPDNDVNLKVEKVNLPEQIDTIKEDKATHSIKPILIDMTNSSVQNSSGIDKGVANYKINVSSANGNYLVKIDATDASTNFDVNDKIFIKGETLTGENDTNDLKINIDGVHSSSSNKLTGISVDTSQSWVARYPTAFEFEVKRKINDFKYYVEHKSGDNIQKGDYFEI